MIMDCYPSSETCPLNKCMVLNTWIHYDNGWSNRLQSFRPNKINDLVKESSIIIFLSKLHLDYFSLDFHFGRPLHYNSRLLQSRLILGQTNTSCLF